jgi:CTP:phosphocholine cytidylyltransferase-like protein
MLPTKEQLIEYLSDKMTNQCKIVLDEDYIEYKNGSSFY